MDEEETKIINENQNIESKPVLRPTPPLPPKPGEKVSLKDEVPMPNNEPQMQYNPDLEGSNIHLHPPIDTSNDF